MCQFYGLSGKSFLLFWHCNNYLTSWNYLFATLAIWVLSLLARLFYLNWTIPWRMSFCVGEEAAVTLLPENAIKTESASRYATLRRHVMGDKGGKKDKEKADKQKASKQEQNKQKQQEKQQPKKPA